MSVSMQKPGEGLVKMLRLRAIWGQVQGHLELTQANDKGNGQGETLENLRVCMLSAAFRPFAHYEMLMKGFLATQCHTLPYEAQLLA